MAEPTDGSPGIPKPDMPARQPTDLPADAPWWARWLDENAKEAWRWASIRWSGAVAIIAEAYALNTESINEYVKHQVPDTWWPHIVALVSLVTLFFRVTKLKDRKND